ncbi:hypothetical protein LXL04_022414 [Taraxacum kok-saghyz]
MKCVKMTKWRFIWLQIDKECNIVLGWKATTESYNFKCQIGQQQTQQGYDAMGRKNNHGIGSNFGIAAAHKSNPISLVTKLSNPGYVFFNFLKYPHRNSKF